MQLNHKKVSEFEVNKWSGGTTTQLAIYPETASYTERNFLFRISTATVEAEESVFTKLPGISRKLMILDGEISIKHKNHYSKILKKFDQDSFEGDWDTKSFGKATDFNLMTTGKVNGEIEAITFQNQQLIKESAKFIGLYFYKGNLKLRINNEKLLANKGDFILINNNISNLNIEFLTYDYCEVIVARINNIDI